MFELPKVIGHRGAAGYAPENTLAAISTAADLNIGWVEIDVKLTKDSVPVLMHDETLERTTNGAGKVAEMTWADLQDLDAGSHFSEGYAGEPVPSLEQALDLIIELDLGLNLEFKPCPSRERETVEAALDILSTYWDDHNRLLLSSFQIQCLETAMDMAPEWRRGLLLGGEFAENWRDLADHLQAATINIDGRAVNAAQLADFLSYGRPVMAYTINDETLAQQLFDAGVSSIFSDTPDLI